MATVDKTKLTAVNDVLRGTGKRPVSALNATGDATIAEGILDRVNEEVQEEEWFFNKDHNVELTPAAGQIAVPTDALRILPRTINPNFVERNGFLYDLDENSNSTWGTQTLRVDVVRLLGVDELPTAARRYVVARAARVYSEDFLGNDSLSSRLERDEVRARAGLMAYDAKTGVLSSRKNYTVDKVMYRPGGNALLNAEEG